MTNSPANYHAISSSEAGDHVEAGITSEGEPYSLSTSEHSPSAVRIKWTYFLLGCAILLPFNALFNATSFFLSRLAGSPFYPTFSSYLSSVYTWTKLACQFYCTFTLKQSSPSRRIFVSLGGMLVLITFLCLSTFFRGEPSTFVAFALFNAACMAIAASYLCTAVFAGAALLGPSFLQAVLSGQAAIAVAVSAVQVVSSMIALWSPSAEPGATVAGSGDDHAEEVAARIFFAASAVFLGVTLVTYMWLMEQPFYQSAARSPKQDRRVGVPADERAGLVTNEHRSDTRESNAQVYRVFRANSIFLFAITYVFTVTLAIYPAITARVRPVSAGIHPMLFTAVHFLVINVGGFAGQYSCSFPRLAVWSGKKILVMSLLRTSFIPLILFCNVDRPATITSVPSIIRSDVLFMIIVLVMGYTTGYVSTMALLAVSSLKHNPRLKGRREDVDVAASLGGACMILGLALGALASFGVQAMV